jgi:hypothetical protein
MNTSDSIVQPISVIKTVPDEGLWDRVFHGRLYRELSVPGALIQLDLSGGPGVPDLVQMSSFPRPAVKSRCATGTLRIQRHGRSTALCWSRSLWISSSALHCVDSARSRSLKNWAGKLTPKAVITTYEHLSERRAAECRMHSAVA